MKENDSNLKELRNLLRKDTSTKDLDTFRKVVGRGLQEPKSKEGPTVAQLFQEVYDELDQAEQNTTGSDLSETDRS